MLSIHIPEPLRGPKEYVFSCVTSAVNPYRFGVRLPDFEIPHDVLWDTVYPMFILSMLGGPLMGKHEQASVVFQYPIIPEVVQCLVDRAEKQGIALSVEADNTTEPGDVPALWDNVVGFGGGKESSLMCGLTRELGYSPRMLMGSPQAKKPRCRWPWPDVSFFQPQNRGIIDRLVIQLMCGRTVYHGAGFGDTRLSVPWTQYYAIGTQEGWDQLNDVFVSLGVDRRVLVPLQCVPFAQMPGILCKRYPEVAAPRSSVDKKRPCEKNMHVSLCEMMNDVPFEDHCSREDLITLIRKFIPVCEDYGWRDGRMLVRLEICAMLYALRNHEVLAPVQDEIDSSWKRDFIYKGHFYKACPPEFKEILRQYLPEAPDGTDCPGGVWIQ